ncbi:retroviral-like aspartic protease family protein [Sphingomonas sp.]|uniref:retroviral-like aspartic protease family protein n=1 Tax=Sphingomonas sp. TaxID=28214 RepID=UPI001EC990F1|nr:retroviral-like aspartic protease family protein [Sphingomonas sp.]MBX3594790.1 aspartyl protease family protein [Sphingomonas sp.]
MGLRFLLALLGAAGAGPALSQDAGPAPRTPPDGTVALGELATRMTVPVSIRDAPPQPFVIDTGAERSVVSRQLASRLGLGAGPQVVLTTMTGSARVGTVVVPSLAVGPVRDERAFNAPALEAAHLGAQGLLGIDQLRAHMVTIDFDRNEMAVRRSRLEERGERVRPDLTEIVVTARNRFGQLIVTEAEFEGVRVTVVMDTGSQISMGNLALQRRLRRIPLQGPITLTSVTGEQMTVNYHVADRVKLGGIAIRNLPVAFADVAPFEKFGLTQRPALMLGMDAMRVFNRIEIDFPARKVRFQIPRDRTRFRDNMWNFGTG